MGDAAAPQHLRWRDFYKNNTKKIKRLSITSFSILLKHS